MRRFAARFGIHRVRNEVDAGGLAGKGERFAGQVAEVQPVEPAGERAAAVSDVQRSEFGELFGMDELREVRGDCVGRHRDPRNRERARMMKRGDGP